MDTTWFPFDEHKCSVIYESWRYSRRIFDLTTQSISDSEAAGIYLSIDFQPNDQWEIIGNYFLLIYIPHRLRFARDLRHFTCALID